MKHILFATFLIISGGAAVAQSTSAPANRDATTPAVTPQRENNAGAPAAGANSFTEAQAKSRIESAGFTNVSGLAKDKDGVWRGKGTKSGASVDVSVDYQGNIVPK